MGAVADEPVGTESAWTVADGIRKDAASNDGATWYDGLSGATEDGAARTTDDGTNGTAWASDDGANEGSTRPTAVGTETASLPRRQSLQSLQAAESQAILNNFMYFDEIKNMSTSVYTYKKVPDIFIIYF